MPDIFPVVVNTESQTIQVGPLAQEFPAGVGGVSITGTQGPAGPPGVYTIGSGLSLDGEELSVNLGTEVQAWDPTLQALAGVTTAADTLVYSSGPDEFSTTPLTAYARTLLDDGDADEAKETLGLDLVDNTSDADKPISTAVSSALSLKVDAVTGQGLSDENFTLLEKNKLSGIQDGAEVNVPADWDAVSGDAAILNKPILGSASSQDVGAFATAAQGALAETALQPVNYLGEYNNGADYGPGAVVTYAGSLWIRVGEVNPGYAPGTSYWTEFEPEIGSPAYDLWIQYTLDRKASSVHSHGNISSSGAIGVTSGLPVVTGTNGVLQTGIFGSTAGTFAQGNDPRLSDERTPLVGSVTNNRLANGSVTGGKIATETITNSNISQSASISDTKLATITTSGKVANSSTSATSSNTAGSIVSRDSSGGFSAGTISASLDGNATSANTASKVSNSLTLGSGLAYSSGGSYDGSTARTASVDSTVLRTSGNQTVGGTKTFSSSVALQGGASVIGDATFNGGVTFSAWPTLPSGEPASDRSPAPKSYVDSVAQGLHVHAQVHAVTTTSLETLTGGSISYSNGTNGVGATLSLGGSPTRNFLSADVWDGDTDIGAGERVLVKNQTPGFRNGIYVISSGTLLTRASDFDTPAEMAGGDFLFVTHGSTYGNTGWVLAEPVVTVGSSPVEFIQFSGAGAYTAGTGLVLNGTVFSHADTSSVLNLSSDNSGNTFIQDLSLTFDANGHVTGASVGTATVQTYSGWLLGVEGGVSTENVTQGQKISFESGSGLTVSKPSAPSGYNHAIRISHDASGVTSGLHGATGEEDGSYIKSVTVDANGHITAITADNFDDRYQSYDSVLTTLASLSVSEGNFIVGAEEGGGVVWTSKGPSEARTALELESMALQSSSSVSITGGSLSGVSLSGTTLSRPDADSENGLTYKTGGAPTWFIGQGSSSDSFTFRSFNDSNPGVSTDIVTFDRNAQSYSLVIGSSGNVGIGNPTSIGSTLTVQSTELGSAFQVNSNDENAPPLFKVSPGGVSIAVPPEHTPQSKLTLAGGDIEVVGHQNGIILSSQNGSRWRITIGDDGALESTLVPTP